MADEVKVPRKEWYQIGDWLSRVDEELEVLIKLNKEMVKYLKTMVEVEVPVPTPPALRPITERLDKLITGQNRDYPNIINEVDVDTSKTTWKELKIHGTGFAIVNVGGGFTIKVPNQAAKELTVVAGDRYDFEFANMYVKGAGAGTGKIRYWRKE